MEQESPVVRKALVSPTALAWQAAALVPGSRLLSRL